MEKVIDTDNRDPSETILILEIDDPILNATLKVKVNPIELFENMLENNYHIEKDENLDRNTKIWDLWFDLRNEMGFPAEN